MTSLFTASFDRAGCKQVGHAIRTIKPQTIQKQEERKKRAKPIAHNAFIASVYKGNIATPPMLHGHKPCFLFVGMASRNHKCD